METRTKGSRKWVHFGVRVLLTIGIFAVILSWLNPADLLAAMKRTGIALWLFTVTVHILLHVAVAWKWRILLEAAGTKPALIDTLRAHGSGVFAGLYMPTLIGGDVIRLGLIAPGGRKLAAAITGGLADRFVDLVALIVLAAFGLLFVPARATGIEVQILTAATLTIVAFVALAVIGLRFVSPKKLPGRLGSLISKVQEPVNLLMQRKRATFIALGASILIQAMFVLQNVLIGEAMGIQIPIAAWFVAWPLAKLASFTPLSIGGLGVRETAFATLLLPFAVPATLAVAESLVWQTVMYGMGLFSGLAAFVIGHLRSSRGGMLPRPSDVTLK